MPVILLPSQGPRLPLIRTLGNNSPSINEYSGGIVADPLGGFYISGATVIQVFGEKADLVLAKYTASGAVEWQQTTGGPIASDDDRGQAIARDSSGNIFVAGRTTSEGSGQRVMLIKYNASGAVQWEKVVSSNGSDARGVAVDASGNVYMVATALNVISGSGGWDFLIMKFNNSGALQWQKLLGYGGASQHDYGRGIDIDSSGNVYVCGATSVEGSGLEDTVIAKYNSSGAIQWQRVLGGVDSDGPSGASSIAVDSAGNSIISGIVGAGSGGAGSQDAFIAKYDTSGVIQWQRYLGGVNQDWGLGVAIDTSDNIFISGFTSSEGVGGEVLIARYDPAGAIQWQRILGGAAHEFGTYTAVDGFGNILVFGRSRSLSLNNDDFLVLRVKDDGTGLGTVGGFTYQASTLTEQAGTMIDQVGTLPDRTPALSVADATTLVTATSFLTETVVL